MKKEDSTTEEGESEEKSHQDFDAIGVFEEALAHFREKQTENKALLNNWYMHNKRSKSFIFRSSVQLCPISDGARPRMDSALLWEIWDREICFKGELHYKHAHQKSERRASLDSYQCHAKEKFQNRWNFDPIWRPWRRVVHPEFRVRWMCGLRWRF